MMGSEFYLVTGTSRGIGRALAQKILAEGQTVLGVSRSRPEGVNGERYHHLSLDLSETTGIGRIMEKVNEIVGGQRFEFVCLVNNASATEPIGPIEKCPPPEIEAHLRIGLVAPLILTSLFIGRFAQDKMRKKVAFISSGAAFRPLPGESIYCSAKAGLSMFGRCIGLEQEGQSHGFEVVSIGPGMVDTSMQSAARSKSSAEFPMADFFKQAFEEGKLQDPDRVAEQIYHTLAQQQEQGSYVLASEVGSGR
jgi:benzil reductase ((S)-benzoin forming)